MISRKFDDLAYMSSSFSIFCAKALRKVFGTKLYEDIVFVLAVTFACGFYQYELFFTHAVWISAALSVCTVIVWLWVSFVNGFLKRGSFIIFTLTLWAVPQILIMWNASLGLIKYNAILDTLSQFSFILFRAPLRQIAEILEIDGFMVSVILITACEVVFCLGFYARKNARVSVWYCKFREHYKANYKNKKK